MSPRDLPDDHKTSPRVPPLSRTARRGKSIASVLERVSGGRGSEASPPVPL